MSEIKLLKDGMNDYSARITSINNNFSDIEALEFRISLALASKEWQGRSHDKCQDLFKLTSQYRKTINNIIKQINQCESELIKNEDDFHKNSSIIKELIK